MRSLSRIRPPWIAFFGAVICLFLLARGLVAAEPAFPALTGRVVDEAGILSPATTQRLTEMSAAAESRTGNQIVVATLKSLQGLPIEDYGYQLGRHWGIGQKGQNNGVILLLAPHERRVRIEVGYGLEGLLTDAQSKIIIESVILPRLRDGDFNAGALAGSAAILRVVTGDAAAAPAEAVNPPAAEEQSGDAFGAIIFIIIFLLVVTGRGLFWPLLFLGGGFGNRRGFSGGGFSGGGFSGGGGSFGGGGASGSW